MTDNIRDYARIGLAHFMFYPDCVVDEQVNITTLPAILARDDIEVVDFCLPYNVAGRAGLTAALRDCDKHLGFAIHPFPLDKICVGTTVDNEKALTRMILEDQLAAAAAAGAHAFTIASGIDPGVAERQAAIDQLREVCRWLCRQAAEHDMTVLLEPFDRDTHRRFLMGPTTECVEFVESLQPEIGNLRLQLDIAHIILSGETFEHAITTAAEHIGHIHLGNCYISDPADPFYGDKHPPIGYPGGEIDVPQLTVVLRALLNIGYLDRDQRGTMAIETRPVAGSNVEQLIQDGLARLDQAWGDV